MELPGGIFSLLVHSALGGMGIGGLTLADLNRIEAATGIRNSHKAVINIHLDGGPPQMDTIDLKPNAPAEIRGEFSPISTRLPDFQISELMPQMAAMADRFVFLRSLIGAEGRHDAFQCQSGFPMSNLQSIGGRPAMGSIVSKLRGSAEDVAPSFVDLMQGRPLVRHSARPGFLGPSYKPFRPDISRWFQRPLEDGMKNELAAQGANHTTSLSLNTSISANRLANRSQLLGGLDRLRHEVDSSGMMDALDTFNQQAAGILLSGKFAAAMDLESEDSRVLKKYTPAASRIQKFTTAENHFAMRKLLLARRLVEAGVRCVSVSFSDFDTHSSNFKRMRHMLPILDHGLCALVNDLEERGMLDDVSIVAWGEFGRTPQNQCQSGTGSLAARRPSHYGWRWNSSRTSHRRYRPFSRYGDLTSSPLSGRHGNPLSQSWHRCRSDNGSGSYGASPVSTRPRQADSGTRLT